MAYLLGSRPTTPEHLYPKAARLDAMLRAGLPVPPGVVLESAGLGARHPALLPLLAAGPVIVRGIAPDEDGTIHSGAGLSVSVVNCQSVTEVAQALEQVQAKHLSYASILGANSKPQALIQRFICGTAVAVVATQPGGTYTELYPVDGAETLTGHQNPAFSGPLAWLPNTPLRTRLEDLCREVTQRCGTGQDLEIVVTSSKLWLVQVRPLTRPLGPEDSTFCTAMARQKPPPDTRGLLVLDGEHNPAPLSPAHQSLVHWLQANLVQAQDLRVVAGWLYYACPPPTTKSADLEQSHLIARAHAAFTTLQTVDLPAAKLQLHELTTDLATAPRALVAASLTHALHGFGQIYRRYQELNLGRLGRQLQTRLNSDDFTSEFSSDGDSRESARSAAAQQPGNHSTPSCLLTRAAYLDVLPVAWDLASPVLAEWVPTAGLPTHTPQALAPHQLATALGELDDHLFALALALVRQVYLRAAAVLEVAPAGDIFYLSLVELRQALVDKLDVREAIRMQKSMHQQLPKQAPRLLYQGHPMAKPGHRPLEGMGLGPGVGGKLAVRHSLAETLADPPEPGTILALPSLTAQAAVVLHTQGIRAVCCEYGGWMSHAAIMARELGLSALIGCQGCTALANGTTVWMDTSGGRLLVEGRVPRV